MKQDINIQQLTCPHIYLFYKKLKHLCKKYGILLKPSHKLKQDEPIHVDAFNVQGKILQKMSAELHHKLESTGCLLRTNKKIDSMVVSYRYSYDRFKSSVTDFMSMLSYPPGWNTPLNANLGVK